MLRRAMWKHLLTISEIIVAASILFKSADLSAHPITASVADTAISAKPQAIDKDTVNAPIDLQSPDSLKTAKIQTHSLTSDSLRTNNKKNLFTIIKTYFSIVKDWANRNEGFIGFIQLIFELLLIVGGVGTLFRFLGLKSHIQHLLIKNRYLKFIIKYHQHLPIIGFETDLRIPILLNEVYVTLWARMTELVPFDDNTEEDFSPQATHRATVQGAFKFAIDKKYDGVVILGQPGSGKTTLAQFFLLCFATGKAKKALGLSQKFLPILLSLREVDPQKSIIENILSPQQKLLSFVN